MTFLKNSVDIIIIAETKLDSSFPPNQFFQDGFKLPYRLDCSKNSGGLLVYINKNIPSRTLNLLTIPKDIQIIPFELNLRKRRWLIISVYKQRNKKNDYLDQVQKV